VISSIALQFYRLTGRVVILALVLSLVPPLLMLL